MKEELNKWRGTPYSRVGRPRTAKVSVLPDFDPQAECSTKQDSSKVFCEYRENDDKVYTEKRKTQKRQYITEGEKHSGRTTAT